METEIKVFEDGYFYPLLKIEGKNESIVLTLLQAFEHDSNLANCTELALEKWRQGLTKNNN